MDIKNRFYNSQYKIRERLIGSYYRRFPSKSNATVDPHDFQPKKVLFVLNGLLGDSVMCTPAIIKARELWKNSHFTLLGKKHNCELLSACPLINEFYETNVDPFSISKSKDVKKMQEWLAVEKFDLAIVLLGYEYAPLLLKAGIPIRVGFEETRLAPCFTHTYKLKSESDWNHAEKLDSLRSLGYRFETILPKLWINEGARLTAKEKLADLGLSTGEKYAVLHPFGSTPRQWWRLGELAPLSALLGEKYNVKTVLIGKKYNLSGTEVVPVTDEEIDRAVINTTGKLSLHELLAVVENSAFVISTDSGPFHIAGALRKPIVGLFRARRPEHAENYPNTSVVFGEDESCQNLCRWDYCRSNPCCQMQKISHGEVASAVDSVLAETPRELFVRSVTARLKV